MNYALVGDILTFRTGPNTEAAWHAIFHDVAFEVDSSTSSCTPAGVSWSSARPHCSRSTSLRMLDLSQTPQPWAEGERSIVLQLSLASITGRRVHPA